mmetsp:Transcript_16470/g.25612  ORF Transcript_16470/g.25612 Transcript_16470/m.25612 type:complete len:866 (+) Transcript_16470:176-2773(+)
MKNIRSRNGSVIISLLLLIVVRNNAFVPNVVKNNLARQHQPQEQQLSYAFSVPQHQQRRKQQQQQQQYQQQQRQKHPLAHFMAAKDIADEKKADEEELSDLDARVLQSMLSEDKLDLNTEENLKKLLDRGVAPKKPTSVGKSPQTDEKDSPFSSTIFQTLTDNEMFTSIKAKATEIIDSAKIYVSNRVERDAKLLASVGIFAWERAVKDVARALPASGTSGAAVGRAVRRAARQLSDSSSFDEMQAALKEQEAEEAKRRLEEGELNLYEELNTPMDEIKSVTRSIRDILSGNALPSTSSRNIGNFGSDGNEGDDGAGAGSILGGIGGNVGAKPSMANRGLRSVAPAGQASLKERQQRAYQRKKSTVLKKQKEGFSPKLGRAAGGLVDTAWEMKQELKTETSKPGYRTEGVRNFIEAAAAETQRSIKAAEEKKQRLLGRDEKTVEQYLAPPKIPDTLPDWAVSAESTANANENAKQFAKELTEEVAKETLLEERERIISSMQLCLGNPEECWLMPDVLTDPSSTSSATSGDGVIIIDDDALRETVTAMICARDDLEADDPAVVENKSVDELVEDLKRMKSSVDMITSLAAAAAGDKAARSLSDILYGRREGEEGEALLLNLDDIDTIFAPDPGLFMADFIDVVEERTPQQPLIMEQDVDMSTRAWFADVAQAQDIPLIDKEVDDTVVTVEASNPDVVVDGVVPEVMKTVSKTPFATEVEVEIVSPEKPRSATVVADAVVSSVKTSPQQVSVEVVDDTDNAFRTTTEVEVVSDTDFDNAVGQVKSAETVGEEENEVAESEPPLPIVLLLRTLDVVFFLLEKILTVGLPGLFEIGDIASKRIAESNKGGQGSVGWKRIANTQDGSKRY